MCPPSILLSFLEGQAQLWLIIRLCCARDGVIATTIVLPINKFLGWTDLSTSIQSDRGCLLPRSPAVISTRFSILNLVNTQVSKKAFHKRSFSLMLLSPWFHFFLSLVKQTKCGCGLYICSYFCQKCKGFRDWKMIQLSHYTLIFKYMWIIQHICFYTHTVICLLALVSLVFIDNRKNVCFSVVDISLQRSLQMGSELTTWGEVKQGKIALACPVYMTDDGQHRIPNFYWYLHQEEMS